MNHGTHAALPPGLAARLAEQTNPRTPQASAIMRAAQFGCGRWLAHAREQLQLTVAELAARMELDAQMIAWVECGLGSPSLLTDDERARFAEVLAGDVSQDIGAIVAVLTIALGVGTAPNPQVMAWVVEDLGFADAATQPVPVSQEDVAPLTLVESDGPGRVLELDEVYMLRSLVSGERHSYAIWHDVVGWRPAGEKGFDNATCLALIARGVDEGWIEALEERFDAELDMERRYFRLTGMGRQVLMRELPRLVALGDQPTWMANVQEWLSGLAGGQALASATLAAGVALPRVGRRSRR